MAKHPAAHARALVQELKGDRDPRDMLREAGKVADPGHAAWAMVRISSDRRLAAREAVDGLRRAADLIAAVERPSRRAELWTDACKRMRSWREGARNPQAKTARKEFLAAAVADIDAMPDGAWVTDAIAGVAAHVDHDGHVTLFRRAARNPGGELAGCKAVVAAAGDALRPQVDALPDALRAKLLGALGGDDAIAAAWAIPDRHQRLEALRVLIWKADAGVLDDLAASCAGRPDEDKARLFSTLAARADKLRMPVDAWLDRAQQAWHGITDPLVKAKEHAKLAQVMQRAGREAPPFDGVTAKPKASQPLATGHADRHTLALVNGYGAPLASPHLRAIGRAAPLCDAFDLDLLLVDFPVTDMVGIADAVQAETRIGEDAHVRRLVEAERLRLFEGTWPGTPVATTPSPDVAKATDLAGLGAVCLIMGLGHHGLPRHLLDGAPHHYEITGKQVSLETATAMGILAERLRSLPPLAPGPK